LPQFLNQVANRWLFDAWSFLLEEHK
jgi:hypothetical protein